MKKEDKQAINMVIYENIKLVYKKIAKLNLYISCFYKNKKMLDILRVQSELLEIKIHLDNISDFIIIKGNEKEDTN